MQYFLYLGSVILIIMGLSMFRNFKVKNPTKNTFSLLIACRNEESNLPALFASLLKLDYPADKFEIIIVDDASFDESPHLLKNFAENQENIRCFYLPEKDLHYRGKKAALKKAAEHARFDFLLFTDADCIHQADWIDGYNDFIDEGCDLITGFYQEQNAAPFRRFSQQFSTALYASTVSLGISFSAAGSNLCVRRSALERAGGYEKLKKHTAGDDKLLLQLLTKNGSKIRFNHYDHVFTKANSNNHENYKRKFGKAKLSSPTIKLLSGLIFFLYLMLPVHIFLIKDWKSFLIYYLGLVFFWCCNLIRHRFRIRIHDLFYLLIYPYFVILYTFWGVLGSWVWKGQTATS